MGERVEERAEERVGAVVKRVQRVQCGGERVEENVDVRGVGGVGGVEESVQRVEKAVEEVVRGAGDAGGVRVVGGAGGGMGAGQQRRRPSSGHTSRWSDAWSL